MSQLSKREVKAARHRLYLAHARTLAYLDRPELRSKALVYALRETYEAAAFLEKAVNPP